MSDKSSISRRCWLKMGAVSAAVAVTGLHVWWIRSRSGRNNKLLGVPYMPPKVDDVHRMPVGVYFSPNGKTVATVYGNITEKLVYLADFPVKKPSDYTLVKHFTNCFKIDGVSLSADAKPRIACRLTNIDSQNALPPILTAEEWRGAGKAHGLSESSFKGSLCVLSADGQVEEIAPLKPSPKKGSTVSTTWGPDDALCCLDRESKDITKYSIVSSQHRILLDLQMRQDEGIRHISWNESLKQYVLLGGDGRVFVLDDSGSFREQTTLFPPLASLEIGGTHGWPPTLDAGGTSVGTVAARSIMWILMNNEKVKKITLPSGMLDPVLGTVSVLGAGILYCLGEASTAETFVGENIQIRQISLL